MNTIFFLSLILIFLIVNILIIFNDFKLKKIPNKFLLGLIILLTFYYINLYLNGIQFNIFFIVQFLVAIFISFILYYYGIWSAGDAKYLLVLTLFIPNIGIIPFIGNIAIITLIYLFGYFIYFYWKVIINKSYRKSLIEKIIIEQRDKIIIFFRNPITGKIIKKDSILKLIKGILYFLLFFVFIRLLRTDIIEEIKEINFIKNNLGNLGSYFVFGTGLISIYLIYSYRFILNKLKGFIYKILKKKIKLKVGEDKIKLINIFLAIIFLVLIIIYDYVKNGIEVFHKLYLIFTLYLALSIGIKMLFYSYKITFQIGEQNFIDIKDLKEGDIVDKTSLYNLFGTQKCLGYSEDLTEGKEGILYPNPGKYIKNIDNPIDVETKNMLINIFQITNRFHKNNIKDYRESVKIKVLNTFSFGLYIFIGFIITYFVGDNIFSLLIRFVINLIKNLTNHR